jgi:hypothetical protein
MSLTIERYLDKVLAYANRPADEATAIRNELRDHLLEKTEAFHKAYTIQAPIYPTRKEFVNHERPHQGIDYLYPADSYFRDLRATS